MGERNNGRDKGRDRQGHRQRQRETDRCRQRETETTTETEEVCVCLVSASSWGSQVSLASALTSLLVPLKERNTNGPVLGEASLVKLPSRLLLWGAASILLSASSCCSAFEQKGRYSEKAADTRDTEEAQLYVHPENDDEADEDTGARRSPKPKL